MNRPDYKRITTGCGLAVAAIGAIVIAGWFLGSHELTAIHADYIPMAPNTALLFVLVGSGLVSLERERRWSDWSARLAASLVITVAFLRFLEFTTPFQFNVDHWIFHFPTENRWVAPETPLFPIGRMGFFSALNFVCAATALLMLASSAERTRQPWAAAFAIITLFIGSAFALGYVYGSPLLYGGTTIPMALNTAVAFVLSGLGLLTVISGREVAERKRARETLQQAHDELEQRVHERTEALAVVNEALRAEIAECQQADERIRLLAAALEAAANGIVIADREGTIVWVNPAYTRLTGYSAEEAIGQNPRILKSGKHDQAFYRQLWETILAGQVWHGETINRRKDGSLYTEDQTIAPVRDERGEISHFIAIKQDITTQKRAEEIHKAVYQLGTILERSLQHEEVYPAFAAAVKILVPYDRICVVVPKGESLVAVMAIANPGMSNCQGCMWPQRANTAIEWVMVHRTYRLVRDLAKEQAFADEAFVAREEGVRSTLLLPLLIGGEALGVLVVDSRRPGAFSEEHVDLLSLVTEQLALFLQNSRLYAEVTRHTRELEDRVQERTQELESSNRQLEAASRYKSEFLSNMSHEFRTPLNSIIGFSEILGDQTFGPLTEKQARYAQNVLSSGRHLLSLINDLLDLAKIEAGKIVFRPEPFECREAVHAAVTEIRPQADRQYLDLDLQVDEAPPTLTADPVRFKQILLNLLSNAVKFTPDGGRITVAVRRVSSVDREALSVDPQSLHPEDLVEIVVADTGIGIKPDDLSRLFQEFVRLETNTSAVQRATGTGLGLALTKRLVELHGGTIAAASEGEGRGSTFTVRLPLSLPPIG